MKKLFNSIRFRLIIVMLVIVFFTSVAINIFVIPTINNSIYQEKRSQVKNLVDSALGILSYYRSLEEDGTLSKEEAQQRAKEEIKHLTYGPDNQDYFWINDYTPRMIMHPFNPQLVGENIGNMEDPDGVKLFKEMVQVVEEKGRGYVNYKWQYYDQGDRIEPKVSYVAGFEEWNWILGTGIYVNDIQERIAAIRNKIILVTLGVLLAVGITTYFLTSYFSKPIERVTKTASQVAKGDLTVETGVRREDEIGQLGAAINTMIEDLRNIVRGIHDSVSETSSASTELAASSEETASSIEEVAQSAQEFNKTVKKVTKNTAEMTDLGDEVDDLAHEGLEKMNNTQTEMEEIIATSQESTEIMDELKGASEEIEEITGVIADISKQTNLLALNASIEAARANSNNQEGQGFAVVAEEIRELAERTQGSVDNIREIIKRLIERTDKAVKIIEENNSEIESGAATLEETAGVFKNIVNKIEQVTTEVEEINEFGEELLKASKQISSETENQSAAMQQIAGASQELTAMSDQLGELIEQFKIDQ